MFSTLTKRSSTLLSTMTPPISHTHLITLVVVVLLFLLLILHQSHGIRHQVSNDGHLFGRLDCLDCLVLQECGGLLPRLGKGQESVTRFKGWFWSIVERMSQKERQELLYFWTSSPSLPANVDSYQPPPSVMIRPPDDQRLPTANTCISRLYIPLYSSKSLVKLRLLTAVKTKTFGFL